MPYLDSGSLLLDDPPCQGTSAYALSGVYHLQPVIHRVAEGPFAVLHHSPLAQLELGSPPGMDLSTERRRFEGVPTEAPVSSASAPRFLGAAVAWRRNFAAAAGSSLRAFVAAAFSARAVRKTGSRRRFLYSARDCSGSCGRAQPTDRKTA